jgi:DNA-binding MarR family transcriptional regulator
MPYNCRMDTPELARFRRAYWQAVRELDAVRLRHWEQHRLTLPQLRVLYQVRRTPGITIGELAPLLGVTVSTTSGLVAKLVDRGLLARTTAPADRRQIPLRLTEAGATLTGELSLPARAYLARVAGRLGDELAAVTAALETLGAAAHAVAGEQATAEPDGAAAEAASGRSATP